GPVVILVKLVWAWVQVNTPNQTQTARLMGTTMFFFIVAFVIFITLIQCWAWSGSVLRTFRTKALTERKRIWRGKSAHKLSKSSRTSLALMSVDERLPSREWHQLKRRLSLTPWLEPPKPSSSPTFFPARD